MDLRLIIIVTLDFDNALDLQILFHQSYTDIRAISRGLTGVLTPILHNTGLLPTVKRTELFNSLFFYMRQWINSKMSLFGFPQVPITLKV